MRGERRRQVLGDFRFHARVHGYPVRHGRSGGSGMAKSNKTTKEKNLGQYNVMPHGHTVSPEKAVEVEEHAVEPF